MADLAEILKRREIKAIHYFHADHYEPWSSGIHEQAARGVERFTEMTRTSPFGGYMSLFYCVFVPYRLDLSRKDPGRRAGRDAVVFRRAPAKRSSPEGDTRPEPDFHESHLHVHHEFWTRNDPISSRMSPNGSMRTATPEMDGIAWTWPSGSARR